jgi:prepilin-type processing-associated H-X9-DG protein
MAMSEKERKPPATATTPTIPLHYGVDEGKETTDASFSLMLGILIFLGTLLGPITDGLHNSLEETIAIGWALLVVAFGWVIVTTYLQVRSNRHRGRRLALSSLILLILSALWGINRIVYSTSFPDTDPHMHVREQTKCSSNLRQLGQAIVLYSTRNAGHYPKRLEDLLLTEEISSEVFVCPDSGDTPATGPTTHAVIGNIDTGGHMSYIYCGANLKVPAPPNTIVAYEALGRHRGRGSNVLFGDGHTEFVNATKMRRLVSDLAAGHNPPKTE